MNLRGILKPKPTISEQDVNKGLRWLTWEGTVSLGFSSITTSGFLVAFALALGANNFQIGILAAIPFIMHIVQLPSIWLVEKLRMRKTIAILSWFPAQLLWFPIALIPFSIGVPSAAAISLLLWLMTARGLLNAVCNAAWNGWIRDLIPQSILGRFWSRRLAFATTSAVIFSLEKAPQFGNALEFPSRIVIFLIGLIFVYLVFTALFFRYTVISIDRGNYKQAKRWTFVGALFGLMIGYIIPFFFFLISYNSFDDAIREQSLASMPWL